MKGKGAEEGDKPITSGGQTLIIEMRHSSGGCFNRGGGRSRNFYFERFERRRVIKGGGWTQVAAE